MENKKNPLDALRTEINDKPTTLDLVSSLMDKDNVVMKTEITNPYALDTLMIIALYFKEHNQELLFNIISKWKETLLLYMVSNKRLGRTEIVEILKGYFTLEREKEKNIGLSSNLAKQKQQSEF